MKKIIVFIIMIISISTFGQEVKKIKENKNYGKATFYVLKSDMKTKHGKYSIKGYTGKDLIVEGNYFYGKKEGLWTERYYGKGGQLKNQGKYKEDNQIGKWIFYDFKGEIIQEYDFDNNKLIKSKECRNDNEYEIFINNELIKSKLDCPPSYIGGVNYLGYELNQKIMTSFDFRTNFGINNKGRTKININSEVSFILTKENIIKNIEFEEPIENNKLRIFIENQIYEKQEKLLVAEFKGNKVDSKMRIPINVNILF